VVLGGVGLNEPLMARARRVPRATCPPGGSRYNFLNNFLESE